MAVPSFIVYPVPTIADETFLQLIFRERVARSLFFGFGRSRMAVVELSDDQAAQEVVEALAADTHNSKSSPVPDDDVPLSSIAAKADDAMDVAEMSLADMFAPPPNTPAAAVGKRASNDNDAEKSAEALRDGMGFDHLPCLAFRGRPIHVVVSGVRVADFYAGGGAVPEKHEEKDERSNAKKKAKKEARQAKTQAATGEGAAAATQPAVATAKPAVANAFPKNACQKCGSLDHFTRHCDGSGSAATAATTAPAPPAAVQDPSAVAEASASSSSAPPAPTAPAATAAAAATRTSGHFPKECCQKCGSANHFTRHCDGSGATPAVAATPAPAAEKVRVAPPTTTTTTAAAATTKPAPAPVVQRTSKDQCKHCGSDAHLSRHCPNK